MAENERPEGAQGERRNVYITLHRNFVREGIEYTDRRTGETRTFNQVTLPAGTVIDGRDVGGYEFSPLFVNPARFRDPEAWRDIPLLADREVRLSRSVLDEEGNPVLGADGRREKDVVTVTPQQIKDALKEVRRAYEERMREREGLGERAASARACSEAFAGREAPAAGRDAR